jgi:hypothetical protein
MKKTDRQVALPSLLAIFPIVWHDAPGKPT